MQLFDRTADQSGKRPYGTARPARLFTNAIAAASGALAALGAHALCPGYGCR